MDNNFSGKENDLMNEEDYPTEEELNNNQIQNQMNDCPPPTPLFPPDSNFDGINKPIAEPKPIKVETVTTNPQNNIADPPLTLVNQNVTQIQVIDKQPFISEDNPDNPNFIKKKEENDNINEVNKKGINQNRNDNKFSGEDCLEALECICMCLYCIVQIAGAFGR